METNQQRSIGFIAVLDVVCVLLLSLSGSFGGFLSTLFYILAFIVPIFIGIYATREENSNVEFLKLQNTKDAIAFIAPTIALIMLVSFLTGLLMEAISGKNNALDLGDSFLLAIITHALAPAVFEEALFRLVPMRVMKGESPISLIVYSATFFALIHHSFFSIPYAFIAGVMFMAINLLCGSVWPSFIIHFINNALSVTLMFWGANPTVTWVAMGTLAVLTVVSVAFIIKNRGKYKEFALENSDLTPLKQKPPKEVLILAIPMLLAAVLELI